MSCQDGRSRWRGGALGLSAGVIILAADHVSQLPDAIILLSESAFVQFSPGRSAGSRQQASGAVSRKWPIAVRQVEVVPFFMNALQLRKGERKTPGGAGAGYRGSRGGCRCGCGCGGRGSGERLGYGVMAGEQEDGLLLPASVWLRGYDWPSVFAAPGSSVVVVSNFVCRRCCAIWL